MTQPLKHIKSIFIILGLALIGVSFSSNAYAQDQEINIQKIIQKNKNIVQKKRGDAVGLNPQPVPPKEGNTTSLQQLQLQTNTQNTDNALHTTNTTLEKSHETSQEIIQNIKPEPGTTATGIVESDAILQIAGTVQVKIFPGWIKSVISIADFRELCPKINLLAKKNDGELYKFTPAYHATRPAFGLPGGRVWCETEKISIPANEDIYFIASVIDDKYQVTPMTQKISMKANELQIVYVDIIQKVSKSK